MTVIASNLLHTEDMVADPMLPVITIDVVPSPSQVPRSPDAAFQQIV